MQAAVTFLSQQSTDKIKSFEDVLSHQLFKLDGQKYAEHLGDNAYRGEEHPFSADSFLYSRCYVVTKGKKFYQEVLQHPSKMPKNKSFEALLKLSSVAFKTKTGEKLDYIPAYIYETFANAEGWGGEGLLNKLFQI